MGSLQSMILYVDKNKNTSNHSMKNFEKKLRRWWLDVEIPKNRKNPKELTGFSVPRNKFSGQDYGTRVVFLCFFQFLKTIFYNYH